jgi:glycosyltransferase involved in cell wall biosynthesis
LKAGITTLSSIAAAPSSGFEPSLTRHPRSSGKCHQCISNRIVRPVRFLFVSSTTIGGSGRSQRELAIHLERNGHEAGFVVDTDAKARASRLAYEQLSDLAARTARLPGARFTSWLESVPGRRTKVVDIDGRPHLSSPIPQNALSREIDRFSPHVVVANSLERLAWRRVHRVCARHGVPVVLYVRETDSLRHLDKGEVPDLLVANAESLQTALRDLGFTCEFVPSVIDTGPTLTNSARKVAFAINPIASRGVDVIWRLAEAAPEIPFVIQESWPLSDEQLAHVEQHLATLPNVEFRRNTPPGPQLYGDTRVLLVPYRVDNRPRVITEAQSNGIPVLAADVPALREAIGAGGSVVAPDDIDAWVSELRALWSDQERYDRVADAALAHSKRPDNDPAAVAARFEALIVQMRER